MADTTAVRVAVRVRPFNSRELAGGAESCISMNKELSQCVIRDPSTGSSRPFTFDFVYDSFSEPESAGYASQQTVWDDLGTTVLDAAFEGFNVSLFAYGQTGSGKSYSMMGMGADRGIIPRAGEIIFARIAAAEDPEVTFKVECSMLEIYNEKVRDLFRSNSGNLRVRGHPSKGPFAEGLSTHAVSSYEQVEALMQIGVKARTVAATLMNATSSRAHTIFCVVFTQTRVSRESGKATDKVSRINLIDLAGSERNSSTGATGERFKESAAINTSLSALGKVIMALASNATGRSTQLVPYRDSVLTHLLKNSLGGNAKTIMIAALSPSSMNYSETLSTLRYADRAKQIQNRAVVNEDPNERLLRELREEMEELRKRLAEEPAPPEPTAAAATAMDEEEVRRAVEAEQAAAMAEMRAQLEENERILRESEKTWEQRLAETQAQQEARAAELERAGIRAETTDPHLSNLNQDPALSGMLQYVLAVGDTCLGKKGAPEPQDVELGGLDILPQHAVARRGTESDAVTLSPVGAAKVCVNGAPMAAGETRTLEHNDRIIFGDNVVFRFVLPGSPSLSEQEIDWELAMAEANAAEMKAINDQIAVAEQEKEAMAARIHELEERMAAERRTAEAEAERQRTEWEAQLRSGAMDLEQQRAREQALREEHEAWEARERELQERLATAEAEAAARQRQEDERRVLDELLLRLLPLVREANAISQALEKRMTFAFKLISTAADAAQQHELRTEVGVLVSYDDEPDRPKTYWSNDKFTDRLYLMREMYFSLYEDPDSQQFARPEDDPFYDPPEDKLVGVARFQLVALQHLVDVDESSIIVDYTGKEEGKLLVTLTPEFPDIEDLDLYEDVAELAGHTMHLDVHVRQALGLPHNLQGLNDGGVYVTFEGLLGDPDTYRSTPVPFTSINPTLGSHSTLRAVVTPELVEYLASAALQFRVWVSSTFVPASPSAPAQPAAVVLVSPRSQSETERLRAELEASRARERDLQARLDDALRELAALRPPRSSRLKEQLELAKDTDSAFNPSSGGP